MTTPQFPEEIAAFANLAEALTFPDTPAGRMEKAKMLSDLSRNGRHLTAFLRKQREDIYNEINLKDELTFAEIGRATGTDPIRASAVARGVTSSTARKASSAAA